MDDREAYIDLALKYITEDLPSSWYLLGYIQTYFDNKNDNFVPVLIGLQGEEAKEAYELGKQDGIGDRDV